MSYIHASQQPLGGGPVTLYHLLICSFDSNVGLFNVPGSLWIDTFIRANYTSDTNAGMVMLLSAMADAEKFLGNTTGG